MSGGEAQEILVTADGATSIPLNASSDSQPLFTGGAPDMNETLFHTNFTGEEEPVDSSMPPLVDTKAGIDPAIYLILAFFFFIVLFYFFYRNQQKKKQEQEAFFRELDGDKVPFYSYIYIYLLRRFLHLSYLFIIFF
jgi:cbb3-type cytochrome oxidase subunit 3